MGAGRFIALFAENPCFKRTERKSVLGGKVVLRRYLREYGRTVLGIASQSRDRARFQRLTQ